MRIAISGSHGTGKSTLVASLARRLPAYEVVDEPYQMLVDEGYAFSATPSFDEFEELLERSLTGLKEPLPVKVLFDRCPIDYLAYLAALASRGGRTLDRWIPDVAEAVTRLDLIVYLPIESPDRVPIRGEGGRLRARVDETIREMLVDDGWGFGAKVLEVRGDPERRVEMVMSRFGGDSAPAPG